MTRTLKQTASAIEKSITEILGYKKKITDELIKGICERNNINESSVRKIAMIENQDNEKGAN